MKNSQKSIVVALTLAGLLSVAGCASNPQVASSLPHNPESPAPVEIVEPFADFVNDTGDAFRARAQAEAPIPQNAKSAAMMNAKVILAGKVNTAIDSVSETSATTAQEDATIISQRNWKEAAKAHVLQTLTNITVLGEKLFRDPSDGRYIAYVAIEVNKKDLANTLSNKAVQTSDEEKAKLRANLEKAFTEK